VLLRAAAAAALVLALAACGGSEQAAEPTSSLPPGCEVAAVQGIVTNLLTAVSKGDRAGIARGLAPGDGFASLTVVDPDRTFTTESRAKAIAYLLGRHRHGENVRLLQMVVAQGFDENHAAIQFVVSRVADDLPGRGIRTHSAAGNGTVDCVSRAVSRWRLVASAG
jgi:hypothetical protein